MYYAATWHSLWLSVPLLISDSEEPLRAIKGYLEPPKEPLRAIKSQKLTKGQRAAVNPLCRKMGRLVILLVKQ